VRRRTVLSTMLSYEQGLELYDLAVDQFPRSDRSLLHHRALWIKDVGGHTAAAYAALEDAAQAPSGGSVTEPEEYVFTSMAATIVKAVREQTMAPADALAKVEELLSKATRPGSLNLHNQHVHASLLLELAGRLRGVDAEGFLSSLQGALRIVDHSLILLCPKAPESTDQTKDYDMMVGLRGEIVQSHHNLEDAKAAALEVYSVSKNQVGFALVARKMISIAEAQNKGSLFKGVSEYISEIRKVVESRGDVLSPDVVLARAENYWRWRVSRRAGQVDWTLIRNDLEEVINSPRYRTDYMVMFWLAVAHFSVGDFGASESYFTRLRSLSLPKYVRYAQRCVYLDHNGNPARLQVEMQDGAGGRLFAYSTVLKTSVLARAPEFHGVDRSAAHAYFAFTMDGPLAVRTLEASLESRLPIDRNKHS
jgi:hypothetical protein